MLSLVELLSGTDLSANQYNDAREGIPYLTGASNFNAGKLIENRWTSSPTRVSEQGDLLFTCKGTIGEMAVNPFKKAHIARQVMAIKSYDRAMLGFLQVFLATISEEIKTQAKGVIPGIERNVLLSAFVPVPPALEQQRISIKLELLFSYLEEYDTLEAAREQLDTEFPDRLRKSILQMAVQGKLVPQDPNDEPASVLLERIREQRRQLIAEGKIKAPKSGASIIYRGSDGGYYEKCIDTEGRESAPVSIDDEIPFDIPDNWEWSRLQTVLSLNSGLGYKKTDLDAKSSRMIRVLRGGNISANDELFLQDSDVFIADQFVEEELQLSPGQIITPAVTSLENVGKAAIIRQHLQDTVCGGFVFYLTPFLDDFDFSDYVYHYLISPSHKAYCKSSVKKSGQAFYNLSKASLNQALIPIPPVNEQRRIVVAVSNLLCATTNR